MKTKSDLVKLVKQMLVDNNGDRDKTVKQLSLMAGEDTELLYGFVFHGMLIVEAMAESKKSTIQ